MVRNLNVPWSPESTTKVDCTLHQLAPYIGRMKTTMAAHLVARYSEPSDTIWDPFCGSGVIPLEAALAGRSVVAGDVSSYAIALTRAKLGAPTTLQAALTRLADARAEAEHQRPRIDLRGVPIWVRRFFHPETLRTALAFRDVVAKREDWFLMSCLLGILHHQRPGFLSFPSSHLVPYLRTKLFPRGRFPKLYQERDVWVRMVAKIERTFRRRGQRLSGWRAYRCDSRALPTPQGRSVVITSPPYMNELDYVRDNRLRLWFLERQLPARLDIPKRERVDAFKQLLTRTFDRVASSSPAPKTIVLVVGDTSRGKRPLDAATVAQEVFATNAKLQRYWLKERIVDEIPDIRRARRDLRGTKRETVLVYASHRRSR